MRHCSSESIFAHFLPAKAVPKSLEPLSSGIGFRMFLLRDQLGRPQARLAGKAAEITDGAVVARDTLYKYTPEYLQ